MTHDTDEPVFPSETELYDDYPVYGDYLYVADGKVYRSDWHNITVGELKRRENFKSVKTCDIFARQTVEVAGMSKP